MNQKTKNIDGFTPGHWYVGVRKNVVHSTVSECGLKIYVESDSKEENEANAALISEAKNMYKALHEMVKSMDIYIKSSEGHGCVPHGFTGKQYEYVTEILYRIDMDF